VVMVVPGSVVVVVDEHPASIAISETSTAATTSVKTNRFLFSGFMY
jgi:hypothetical protein